MLYSSKSQFLFIHIYKTGGNSIRKVLEPYADGYTAWYRLKGMLRPNHVLPPRLAPKHANALTARKALGQTRFSEAFKFAFVRNPWDWQVSLYHFGLKDKSNHHHKIIASFPDFEAYLQWRITKEKRLQKELISDREGKVLVDFTGRFERLQEDFDQICEKLGLPQKRLPRLNPGKHAPYRRYYTDETAEWINKAYAEDIEAFGYSF